MRASLVTIREMCSSAIEKANNLATELADDPNPIAQEIRATAQGRRQAFEAIFEATYADYFSLKTFTNEK